MLDKLSVGVVNVHTSSVGDVDKTIPWTPQFVGRQLNNSVRENFFVVGRPCGVTAKYASNKFPEVDTPHPCGNPEHWTVKYV